MESSEPRKQCTKCGAFRTSEMFHTKRNLSGGLCPSCRLCSKMYIRDNAETRNEHKRFKAFEEHGYQHGDYNRMLEAQRGKCAICGTETPGGRGRFHVDHCHGGGGIRGLLCMKCNSGIGMLNDDTDLLRTAIEYLERGGTVGQTPDEDEKADRGT